ncbi:DUF6383 domain-containing protein [Parabacteroides sp. OttesenSCG-928-J18]|nr:DUF6383 domain-containing protein [Parabacteroides sp. OttesenSCG-928-J18]
MNKKFFTLLVAMIATISFGAFAQSKVALEEGALNPVGYEAGVNYVLEVSQDDNGTQTPVGYLVADKTTGGDNHLKFVKKADFIKTLTSYAALDKATWAVTPNRPNGEEVAYYTFKNAGTGANIGYLMSSIENKVGADIPSTSDLKAYNINYKDSVWVNAANVTVRQPSLYFMSLNTELSKDSVLALAFAKDADAIVGVYPAKYKDYDALAASKARVIITPRKVTTAKFTKAIANGVYIVTVKENEKNPAVEGKTIKLDLTGKNVEYFEGKDLKNAQHMPSAQWVITNHNSTLPSTDKNYGQINAYNREFSAARAGETDNAHLFVYEIKGDVPAEGTYANVLLDDGSILTLTQVAAANVADSTLGYWAHDAEVDPKTATAVLRYLNLLSMDNAVYLNSDSVLTINKDGQESTFHLIPTNEAVEPYGFIPATDNTDKEYIAGLKRLARSKYMIGLKTPSKNYNEAADWQFVVYDSKVKKAYTLTAPIPEKFNEAKNVYEIDYSKVDKALKFYLKENNLVLIEGEGEAADKEVCYYALLHDLTAGNPSATPSTGKPYQWASGSKVNIAPGTLELVLGDLNDTANEVSTAAFAITRGELEKEYGYRLFGDLKEEKDAEESIVKIFRAHRTTEASKAYLYEDANSVYSVKPIGPNEVQVPNVPRENQINFLGVDEERNFKETKSALKLNYIRGEEMPQYVISVDESWTPGEPGKPAVLCDICKEPGCDHSKPAVPATDGKWTARVLVNLIDSVGYEKVLPQASATPNNYMWENTYYRLAFVDAELVLNEKADQKRTIDSLYIGEKLFDFAKFKMQENKDEFSTTNLYSPVLFSFRFLEKENTNFLIESESWGTVNNNKNAFAGQIYPFANGGWIKYQNGVPVIVNSYVSKKYAWDEAEVFNWEVTSEEATSNEGPAAGAVEVTAAYGTITVTGAAGQAVVITDILGKVIANTVITSDAATFAAPAGVAVVKVAGEAAKVLVK